MLPSGKANRKQSESSRAKLFPALTLACLLDALNPNKRMLGLTLSGGGSFELTSDGQQCHVADELGVGVHERRVVSLQWQAGEEREN